VVVGPAGVDVLVAPPRHRIETVAAIALLAGLVALVAGLRAAWLAPATTMMWLIMAATDPLEPGPWWWSAATVVADLALVGLGLRAWRLQGWRATWRKRS
jgi:hypothetical protein